MSDWSLRTKMLIGEEKFLKLEKSSVIIFGIGGVGSYAVEALARAGIGRLTLVDYDVVDTTNINRQIHANTENIGQLKVELMADRIKKINTDLQVRVRPLKYTMETSDQIDLGMYDYIIDAIDMVSSKLLLVEKAFQHNIPIISCMGTGNKLNPMEFEVADINKTSMCPLAKVMRKELKKRGIPRLKVVYSKEKPSKQEDLLNLRTPASISFVPPVAGMILASEVVKNLILKDAL